jgi:hypothetical protein
MMQRTDLAGNAVMPRPHPGLLIATLVISLLAGVKQCAARPPEIRNVSLRGLQIGAATVLTIDGADLLPTPRIYLNDLALDATIDPQSTATRLVISASVPESVVPGIGTLRLATADGFSNSQLVGLDRFPQMPLTENLASHPAAVHGSVPGSGVSRTSFPGKAGEELILDVEARRLGSKLRPVIHVYDSRRVQLAWATPRTFLFGDTRLVLKLPRDEIYTVEVHDSQYAPPGPSYFRLKVGQWKFADLAFPPAIARGQQTSISLIGNGADSSLVQVTDTGFIPVPWPAPTTSGGLPPTVLVSNLTELIEAAGDQPTPLQSLPLAVSGRLTAPGQRDRFPLMVPPGSKLIMELFAERIHSPIDAAIEVRNDKNALLASNDDGATTIDPRLEFSVPADQPSLEIVVRDNLELGGNTSIYRLVVTPADAVTPQLDVVFRPDVVNVAAGETQVVEVFAPRQGFDGPIQLQMSGLPTGMQATGVEIPAGTSGTLLSFVNSGTAVEPRVVRMQAQSADGQLRRTARAEVTPDDRLPPWVRESFAIATTPANSSPFRIAMTNEALLTHWGLSSKPVMSLQLVRPPSTFGPIRLSLVTSQYPPRANGQPNLPQTIRAEKPVEVPVDNAVKAAGDALAAMEKQLADAMKQAQGAQGDAKTAADARVTELTNSRTAAEAMLREAESKAIYKVDYVAIFPSTLLETSCDLAVKAELLNPEKNTVLRTTYSPVKRLPVQNPLSIKLATAVLETPLDPKGVTVIKVPARVERLGEFKGDVTVSVTGLTAGVTAPNVQLKGDQTDFTVEVRIPMNFAGNEVTGLQLIATGPPDPLSANIPVKSAETGLTIKINRVPAP